MFVRRWVGGRVSILQGEGHLEYLQGKIGEMGGGGGGDLSGSLAESDICRIISKGEVSVEVGLLWWEGDICRGRNREYVGIVVGRSGCLGILGLILDSDCSA